MLRSGFIFTVQGSISGKTQFLSVSKEDNLTVPVRPEALKFSNRVNILKLI